MSRTVAPSPVKRGRAGQRQNGARGPKKSQPLSSKPRSVHGRCVPGREEVEQGRLGSGVVLLLVLPVAGAAGLDDLPVLVQAGGGGLGLRARCAPAVAARLRVLGGVQLGGQTPFRSARCRAARLANSCSPLFGCMYT